LGNERGSLFILNPLPVGQIFFADLPPMVDSEIGGRSARKICPTGKGFKMNKLPRSFPKNQFPKAVCQVRRQGETKATD